MASSGRRSTDSDGLPMVARWGSEDPSAPLVVALHGNGTSEHSLIEISPWLPHGPVAYVSVRAPIEQGTGYSWFLAAGDGAGGPDPESLTETSRWFLRWLDTEGDPDRPILLLGFRDGVTLAGALMLEAPHRFSGAALLYGALPFSGERGRLAGMPVFLAHGSDDTRTPAHLLARTWDWLARESGAPLWAERVPGGDQLAGKVVGDLGTWLADRLDHLRAHGENPVPDGDEPEWPTLGGKLPHRAGEPPELTSAIPQHQLTQTAPPHLQSALWARLAALDGVTTGPTTVGVEGIRALFLDRAIAAGPDAAFVLPDLGEFAHLHPEPDSSLHVVLPDALAYDALAKGWAVAHPLAGLRLSRGMVLVPGPRDESELDIVAGITAASHRYASG
ncbi:luciferase family protein [Pseudonocardia sp.]|uniref:luciferase domain-containing protein n=1 Tax=Pseudonocardia sp. TaxID=60912 RepID=UPI002631CA95|nr:luciferase family protein [Pseudonocardia sp.]MCW2721452.1 phospholipase/Carboxylesterase [Pseudonocardia sp.]